MGKVASHRWRRRWASGSPVLLGGGTALIIALGTVILANVNSALTPTPTGTATISFGPYFVWVLLAGTIIGLILLVLQWRAEYRRRTYDPTWVVKFDALFDNNEMWKTRSKAASALKDHQGELRGGLELTDVDDVLDFFENLGFYMKGDHITPEVAHHTFHYWIRGYYTAARDYIEDAQEDEPTAWECVPELFEAVHEIEEERAKGKARKFE